MTVAANMLVDSARFQYVAFTGAPVLIPATVRSITVLTVIATNIRAITQNLAGSILLDTPVFAVDPRLAHYSNTGATVLATDSLALSVKPLSASTATHAVGVYIERIDQTDNDVYLDVIGTSDAVIVFEY
ncbi:MAG: hypothetical protein ACEQSD_09230 [Flavobacteriales bacterium]